MRTRSLRTAAALVALVVALAPLGCDRDEGAPRDTVASSALVGSSPPPPASTPRATQQTDAGGPRPFCQAMLAEKVSEASGAALTKGSALDGGWLEIADGGRLDVRHSPSGREWTLQGPALVAPCRSRELLTILPFGTLSASAAPAAHPVPSLSVAIPQGLVQHVAGQLTVRASGSQVEFDARSASASFEREGDTEQRSVLARRKKTLNMPLKTPEALVVLCEGAAKQAADLSGQLLEAPRADASPLGEQARKQLRARVAARSRCATALARVTAGGKPQKGLLERVEQAESLWQRIPPLKR